MIQRKMKHKKEIKSTGVKHRRKDIILNQVVKERLTHQNKDPKEIKELIIQKSGKEQTSHRE